MDKKKDPMDQMIVEDLLNEADAIDREISEAGMGKMPADLKDRIKKNLHEQIDAYEKERVVDQLSEEDKKALELGRKMLEKEASEGSGGLVVYRKKRKRMFVAVAAVAVLVLAMGVTSMGGAARVVEMMKVLINGREVVRVDTEDDNYIVSDENEEAAYQEIKDVFGGDAVRPTHWPEGTVFVRAEIERELQIATLIYEYNGNRISYYISSHHTDSSLGIDVEDNITDKFYMGMETGEIEIKEYETSESKTKRYSAKYTYSGLEYYLIGTMDKQEFVFLIKNLNFFKKIA